ncbi:hypothetical protein ACSQ67_007158 [Phaseolus vulgaris]
MSEFESEIAEGERYRVGYALQPKKVKSFLQPSLLDYAKQHAIDLVQIDPSTPLEQQGPFHCIIHKLHTPQWNNHLQQFSATHPDTAVIDPPDLVSRLHNRVSMLEAVTHLQISIENATIGVPNQVVVNEPKAPDFDKIEESGLRFPVIAKPLAADGGDGSHELCLVFDRDGLNSLSAPTVLQEFVNHEAENVEGEVLPFSRVSNLGVEDEGGAVEKTEMPAQCLVDELAKALREALGLNLFNVDVIRDSKEPTRYLVIDINYFPGYAKWPSYEPFITGFLLDVVRTKAN